MVNINKILELKKQAEELERHRESLSKTRDLSNPMFYERQNAIEKMMLNSVRDLHNPHNGLNNHLIDSIKSLGLTKSLNLAENTINKTFIENFRGFHDISIQNSRKLIEEVFSPLLKNSLLSQRLGNDFEQIRESLLAPLTFRNSDVLRELALATKATAFSSLEVLSKSFLGNNLLKNENLLGQISSSVLNYDRFANSTLAKLNLDVSKSMELALRGSLTLANEQMLRSTTLMQSYIESSDVSNFEKSNPLYDRGLLRTNRYRVQKLELLRREDIEEGEEYESLIIKSPSAVSFEQLSNCMTLIGLCNEAAETTKGNSIFTLTTSLWLSAWKLTDVVPTNKDRFAIIVDCLYLMLYEGAGKDKLRFIEDGYISATEAEVIWKIKHLRNKWLRHDINHGKDSDIRKSHQNRREALEWFGVSKIPYTKDEFVFLYSILILRVEEFLKLLLERVSNFSNLQ
jgi:hypothetical protein